MSRPALVALVATTALAVPVSKAHAGVLDDVARRGYRLGVAALDAVDATPEQRRQVRDAASDLYHRLQPFEADVRALARDAHRVWVAEEVERDAVEAVRVETVGLLDEMSVETVDFVVDVADTLTAEQRRELARHARARVKRLVRD